MLVRKIGLKGFKAQNSESVDAAGFVGEYQHFSAWRQPDRMGAKIPPHGQAVHLADALLCKIIDQGIPDFALAVRADHEQVAVARCPDKFASAILQRENIAALGIALQHQRTAWNPSQSTCAIDGLGAQSGIAIFGGGQRFVQAASFKMGDAFVGNKVVEDNRPRDRNRCL